MSSKPVKGARLQVERMFLAPQPLARGIIMKRNGAPRGLDKEFAPCVTPKAYGKVLRTWKVARVHM